ncbi:hypothetical protein [Lysobacter gummosus]|uniref:hypothetical protein n=1 Tax=Lysobacter gummosus TaxID=262324 RepID=UPI0036399E32
MPDRRSALRPNPGRERPAKLSPGMETGRLCGSIVARRRRIDRLDPCSSLSSRCASGGGGGGRCQAGSRGRFAIGRG